MDTNLPSGPDTATSTPTPSVPPVENAPKNKLSLFFIVIIILGLIGVSVGGYSVYRNNKNNTNANNQQNNNANKKDFKAISAHTLVFGQWADDKALIFAMDLTSGEQLKVAELSTNVKKVTVTSPETILYIDQTDDRDHGKQLVTYSLKDKKKTTVFTSSAGFGIDDYVISPNKQYVAVWEVAFASNSGVLSDGKSRVQAFNLVNPASKNTLYDETQTGEVPVHYPRAITDSGEVYVDSFIPNKPQGWAYGMSVVSFDGARKQEVLRNGTYATQPALSPDGKYLAFSGYDGSKGPGEALKNGFRQGWLSSNTVELLDTTTKTRQKLTNLPNTTLYTDVRWDQNSGDVLYSTIKGTFSYNLTTKKATQVLDFDKNVSQSVVASLGEGKQLVGRKEESGNAIGNLGSKYTDTFTKIDVAQNNNATPVLQQGLMQYITILPGDYFAGIKQAGVAADDIVTDPECVGEQKNLQLCTFDLPKPSLAPVRQTQQTKLRCEKDLAEPQCKEQGLDPESKEYDKCVDNLEDQYKEQGVCYDSPLYLYGATGKKVQVKINTPVHGAVPSYSRENGYLVTIAGDNKMQIGDAMYDSIDYDYNPAIKKLTRPTSGNIVAKQDVEKVLTTYAMKLGLNSRETRDLVVFGKESVSTPYAFVSFFDQVTSKRILPISFTPTPDTYINYVFYFKLLNEKPNFTPMQPEFPNVPQRGEFAAVEISGIVE